MKMEDLIGEYDRKKCPVKQGDIVFALKDIDNLVKHCLYIVKGAEYTPDGSLILAVESPTGDLYYADIKYFQGYCEKEFWPEALTIREAMEHPDYDETMEEIAHAMEMVEKMKSVEISEEDDDEDDDDEDDDYDNGQYDFRLFFDEEDDEDPCYGCSDPDCDGCPYSDEDDPVNHPSHYTQGGIECIEAIKSAVVGKTGIEAVCVANVIKYLWRYEEKNGIQDVKKAKWYLEYLLKSLEEIE